MIVRCITEDEQVWIFFIFHYLQIVSYKSIQRMGPWKLREKTTYPEVLRAQSFMTSIKNRERVTKLWVM